MQALLAGCTLECWLAGALAAGADGGLSGWCANLHCSTLVSKLDTACDITGYAGQLPTTGLQ